MKSLIVATILLAGTTLGHAGFVKAFYTEDCSGVIEQMGGTFIIDEDNGHIREYISASKVVRVDARTIIFEGVKYRAFSDDEIAATCG